MSNKFQPTRKATLRDCDLCDKIQRVSRKHWSRDTLELYLAMTLNDLDDARETLRNQRKRITDLEEQAPKRGMKMLRRAGLIP